MGRLLDLVAASGLTPEQLAGLLGVRPLLLQRIDAGLQPMPADLLRLVAGALGADPIDVATACPRNTALTGPSLRVALPARLGEPVSTARVSPTHAVTPGGPAPLPLTHRELLVFFADNATTDGSHILEEWRLGSDGTLTLVDWKANNDDILGTMSGFFVPPSAPTGLVTTSSHEGQVDLLDPATFAEQHVLSAVGALQSTQLLAWDPTNAFAWFGKPTNQQVARIALTPFTLAASVSLGTGHTPRGMCFGPADGLLYALVRNTPAADTDWLLVQVRPTPGSEARLMTSTPWTSTGSVMDASAVVAASADPGAFFSGGDPGGLILWAVQEVSITPSFVAFSGPGAPAEAVNALDYDAVADRLWGLSGDKVFRCTRSGAIDFLDDVTPQSPPAARIFIVPDLDVVVAPSSVGEGQNVLRVYRLSRPGLLTETLVGGGPNAIGSNLAPLSFAVRP